MAVFRQVAMLVSLAAAALPYHAGAESDETLALVNRTCGAVTVTLDSDASCSDFSSGCNFTLDAGRSEEIAIAHAQSLRRLEMKIDGHCSQPQTSIVSGRCVVDTDHVFGAGSSRARPFSLAVAGMFDGFRPEQWAYEFGTVDAEYMAPAPGPISVALSDCATSADGESRVCTVACSGAGY